MFHDWSLAMTVTAVWLLSPTAIYTTFFLRHYLLFTLMAAVFAYVLFKFLYAPQVIRLTARQGALIALVVAGGMLTHYYFIWVIAAGMVAVGMKSLARQRERIIWLMLCLAGGALIFVALHPEFYRSLRLQGKRTDPDITAETIDRRAQAVFDRTLMFFADNTRRTPTRDIILAIGMVPVPLALIAIQMRRSAIRLPALARGAVFDHPSLDNALYIGIFALVNYGMTTTLYTLSLSPVVAMVYPWYMSVPWLYCAFMPVLILHLPMLRPFQTGLLASLIGGMLVLGLMTFSEQYDKRVELSKPEYYPDGSEQILIGTTARGVIMPMILNLKDENDVFVADTTFLLAHPDDWLPQVTRHATWSFAVDGSVMRLVKDEGVSVKNRRTFWPYGVQVILPENPSD
jgi:hypothetical protein